MTRFGEWVRRNVLGRRQPEKPEIRPETRQMFHDIANTQQELRVLISRLRGDNEAQLRGEERRY